MSTFLQSIESKFNKAKESKDLISFETSSVKKESGSLEFQLTLAPALGQKSKSKKEEGKNVEKIDPFLNPNPALVIEQLKDHILLFNKFAVIPNHLLLVTKEFRKQSEPLMPNDLYEAFKVIKDFGHSQPSLVFYNCGEESGASQAHKHLQIIPLKTDNGPQPPIKKLFDEIHDRHIGQIYAINKLPFVHVIMGLDSNIIRAATDREDLTGYLAQMFFGLLDAMFQQLRENAKPLNTSYNFLMTEEFIMLIPRSKEVATVHSNGKKFEFSFNSLAYAGLLLCKTEEELQALESQEDLIGLLAQTGVAWDPQNTRFDAERKAASDADLA